MLFSSVPPGSRGSRPAAGRRGDSRSCRPTAISEARDERIGPLDRADVVVEDERGLVPAVPGPDPEREDDDDRQRGDEQGEVPQGRPGRSGRVVSRRAPEPAEPRRLRGDARCGRGRHPVVPQGGGLSRRCSDLNSSQMSMRWLLPEVSSAPSRLAIDILRREDRRVVQDLWVDELAWPHRCRWRTG